MLNSWFPLCRCDILSWFTWYWIHPRLQLIQKASTNAVSHLRSKWHFKSLAKICISLMPDSFRAESIIWASLSALRSPNLTVQYEWHETGSCRGLLFCISSWCRRERRLVLLGSARRQWSIYTALAGWNCIETAAISSVLKLKRGGCL